MGATHLEYREVVLCHTRKAGMNSIGETTNHGLMVVKAAVERRFVPLSRLWPKPSICAQFLHHFVDGPPGISSTTAPTVAHAMIERFLGLTVSVVAVAIGACSGRRP